MARSQVMKMWALAGVAAAGLTGCHGEVVVAGHLTSLGMAVGMFWATLNLNRGREK